MSFYGFRRWRVGVSGELLPLTFNTAGPWRIGQQQPASTCLCFTRYHLVDAIFANVSAVAHEWPKEKTGRCGYYLHRHPVLPCLCGDSTARHGAVGVVRGWGRYVEHEEGWRAQYVEIVGLVDYTGTVDPGYSGARYPDLATMYAEWAPGATVWATDDVDWCGVLSGGYTGMVFGSAAFCWAPLPWVQLHGGPIPRQGTWDQMVGYTSLLRESLDEAYQALLTQQPDVTTTPKLGIRRRVL